MDCLDVAVTVVAVAILNVTAAETGHKAHDVAVLDLEGVEILNVRPGGSDEVGPCHLRQITVGFLGWFELSKSSGKIGR